MDQKTKVRKVIINTEWPYSKNIVSAFGDCVVYKSAYSVLAEDSKLGWRIEKHGMSIAYGRCGEPASFFRLPTDTQKFRTRLSACGVDIERRRCKTYAWGIPIKENVWYRSWDFVSLAGVDDLPTWGRFMEAFGFDDEMQFPHVVNETPTGRVLLRCKDCNWWFERAEMHNEYYCNECYTNHICGICGEAIDSLENIVLEGGVVKKACRACRSRIGVVAYCHGCAVRLSPHGVALEGNYHHDGYVYFCPSCARTRRHCEHCSRIVDMGETCPCQDPIRVENYHDGRSRNAYNYVFRSEKDDIDTANTLGVELEMGLGDVRKIHSCEHAKNLYNGGLIHFEHDGSLNSVNGVEMITAPCSFRYHAEKFRWPELCKGLLAAGYRSHDKCHGCCGFHIHIGRYPAFYFGGQYSKNLADLLDLFVNRAWKFFSRIGRRNFTADENEDYCGSGHYAGFKPGKCGKDASPDRYRAVNLTNAETIELRFPKGTLNSETIIGTLAMADFLPMWCKDHLAMEDGISADPLMYAEHFHKCLLADPLRGAYYKPMADRLLPSGIWCNGDGSGEE